MAQHVFGTTLTEREYEQLQYRGITHELAEYGGLRHVDTYTGREVMGVGDRSGDYEGILIPYFNPGTDLLFAKRRKPQIAHKSRERSQR